MREELSEIFGERVCFNDIERNIYSKDISALPDSVMNKIECKPDAIVQPVNVDEMEKLLKFCHENEIPVVPRGAATSGYGGAVPSTGGIVVDFCRMNNIIEISDSEKAVEVQSGVIWNVLERALNDKGLSLKIYPSSSPSATVGGWVGNGGGVGIGSYEFGTFREHIIECEIVTPKGVKRLSGDDIDLVFGFSGTTGLISRIKFEVKERNDVQPVLAAFDEIDDVVRCISRLDAVDADGFSIWHVSFKNRENVRLSAEAIEKQRERHPLHHSHHSAEMPEKHIALFVARLRASAADDAREDFRDKMRRLVRENGGEVLDDELARSEWNERFNMMKLKALGPSLITSEIKMSAEKIPNFVEAARKKFGDLAFECMLSRDFAVLLCHMLADERKRGYLFESAKSLLMIELGKKMGGSPYAIGMYLTDDAEECFGDVLMRAYEFKKSVDEKLILNPGKAFPEHMESEIAKHTKLKRSPTERLIKMLRIARKTGRFVSVMERIPGRIKMPREDIIKKYPFGEDALTDAFICMRCGYCVAECPVYTHIKWEGAAPRGMFCFIKDFAKGILNADDRMLDIFFVCTTCERCNFVCPLGIPILQRWDFTMRPALFKELKYEMPSMFRASLSNVLKYKNAAANPHEERVKWLPEDAKYADEGEICYWAGCIPSYTVKNMAENAMRILNRAGIVPVYLGLDEWCCGAPVMLVGGYADISDVIRHNIEEFSRRGVKKVITSCPGCWITLSIYYPVLAEMLNMKYDVEVIHISQLFDELIRDGKIKLERELKLKVTYHDPCHIGRAGGIYDAPRNVIRAIPGVELVEMSHVRDEARCCGRHVMRYPHLGAKIAVSRVKEAAETGADAIVTSCASCIFNLNVGVRDAGVDMDVYDISDLVAMSMGLKIRGAKEIADVIYNIRDNKQIPALEKEEERWRRLIMPH